MTISAPLTCPRCRAELKAEVAPLGAPQPCQSCHQLVEGLVCPAFSRAPVAGKAAEALIFAEEAGCFYHPQNRGQVPCDFCGRFLCALCDVELSGQHFCPACVNAGRKKKRLSQLDEGRMLYGGLAVLTAIIPMLIFWPITMVTGPVAIFLAIYGWNKPPSLTGARRSSFIFAIILGLIQTALWVLLTLGIFQEL